MVVLVKLAEYRSRETLAVLRDLGERAMRGELLGIAVCAMRSGGEDFYFTGRYRCDPARVVNAAARISLRLTMLQDAADT